MKWSFFKPIKVFDQLSHRKTKQKQKWEKVYRSNWKISQNRGILKHIWWKVIREILMFRMLWNTLNDGLCCLQNESVSIKVFLLNMHKVRILFDLEKPTLNLLRIQFFFYENFWPRLTWSSKCKEASAMAT